MRFVCESCRAQYMINDEKVGPKGVKVRCRKCGYVILVKKSDGTETLPVPVSNDPDDAQATQVMQSPIAGGAEGGDSNGAALGDSASATMSGDSGPLGAPGVVATGAPKEGENFFGADEDEIGAVFDQVLKTGSSKSSDTLELEGDRQSTRVIDGDEMKKLAEASSDEPKPAEPKAEDVPQTDWYVAIHDKQTGPLALEDLKEHWEQGEIGPDSLCWRAGYSDWIPLSDVKALAALLAPKPPKPIVVPSTTTVPGSVKDMPTGAPSVVSMPVQSAFSAGGMVQTVQSEVQVPMAAAPSSSISVQEDTGTWKPSAASALASLVKDEMEALAKPPPKKVEEELPAPAKSSGGLLDLPPEAPAAAPPRAVAAPVPVERPAPPPVNPYLQNPAASFSAPPVTEYRPRSNQGVMIAFGVGGGIVVLALIGIILWLAVFRETAQPAPVAPPTTPVAAATPTPPAAAAATPTPPPPAAVPTPPPAAVAPPTAAAVPPPTTAAAATPPPAAAAATPTPPPAPAAVAARERDRGRNTRSGSTKVEKERDDPPPPPPEKREEKAASKGSGDDEFDDLFGGEKKKAPASGSTGGSKKGGYVPPAPGGGDAKEELSQSDIFEVVVSNKGSLAKCAQEQRSRDASKTGTLVMKWTIKTSGATSNVSAVTGEFRDTYMAQCVGGLIKTWSFPRHKVQHAPVEFPFKF